MNTAGPELTDSIRVRLLGVPSVVVEGKTVTSFRSNRVPALLGLLASRPGPWQRDVVAAALWPDHMHAESRHNLRQTLLYTRQLLGENAIVGDRQTVELSLDLKTDLHILLRVTDSLQPPQDAIINAEAAIDAYRGEFLAGMDGDWIYGVRSHCARAFVGALLRIADDCLESSPAKSLEYAQRAVEAEPYMDGARLRKINALRALGEVAAAHREYAGFRQLLTTELGIDPSHIVSEALVKRPSAEPIAKAASTTEPTEIDFLLARDRPFEALDLAVALVPYWIEKGLIDEAVGVMRRALEANPDQSLGAHQRGLVSLAQLLADQGKLFEAKESLTEAIPRLTNVSATVKGLLLLARINTSAFRARVAEQLANKALELAIQAELVEERIEASRTAVDIAFQLENMEAAEKMADETVEIARRVGDWRSYSVVVTLAAIIRFRSGREEEALRMANEALVELSMRGSVRASFTRVRLNRLLEEMGDAVTAEAGYRRGIEEARQYRDSFGLAVSLTYLGDLLTVQDRLDEALKVHAEALQIRHETGEQLGEATSLRGLGRIYLKRRQFVEAREALRDSSRLYLLCDALPGHASVLLELARVSQATHDFPLAQRIAERAQEILRGMSLHSRLTIGPRSSSILDEVDALVEELAT